MSDPSECQPLSLTPARAALADQQAKAPPTYPRNSRGADRGLALARVIPLPEALEQKYTAGSLAFGEVGDLNPDTRTFPLADQNFLVVMTSGMMDFLYAVGRALAGAAIVWSDSGEPQNAKALTMSETVALTAQVFKQWRRHCQPGLVELFRAPGRIEHADFELDGRVGDIHEALTTSAELFMMAHEIGHVMLDLGLVSPPLANEELRADSVGFSLYLPPAQDRVKPRMALAGAAFAIRVTESLANAGARFTHAYPPAIDRLQALLAAMQGACPSQQFFDEAATLLVNWLDIMDAIDARIAPAKTLNPLAGWQMRVRLVSVLQAVAEGCKPPSELLVMIAMAAQESRSDLAAAAQVLRRYYASERCEPGYLEDGTRLAMAAALADAIKALDPGLKSVFAG